MVALLLSHLALVVLIAGLRFAHDLDLALGFTFVPRTWAVVGTVLFGGAAWAVAREIHAGRAPWSGADRAAAWGVLVVVPALHWSVGDAEAARGIDLVLLGVAGLLGWLVVLRRPAARSRGFWWGGGWPAWAGLLSVTAGVIAALLHGAGTAARTALPWLTYPLYALFQLGLLLELPERVWRGDGVGRAARLSGLSVLFALVHGPNPIVLGLTAAGMVVLAFARVSGMGLVPLAISMGLLGATVAQTLPADQTQNMRVGAGYLIKRVRAQELRAYRDRVRTLSDDAAFARGGSTLAGWLDLVHLDVFGQPFDEQGREAWIARIRAGVRIQVVRMTLDSEEFRRRHGIEREMYGPDHSLLSSTFRPWHPAQAGYDALRARAERLALQEDHASFVLHVYRTLQGRTPAAEELAAWSPHPDEAGRREIVRLLLEEAGIEDPGTGPGSGRDPDRADDVSGS